MLLSVYREILLQGQVKLRLPTNRDRRGHINHKLTRSFLVCIKECLIKTFMFPQLFHVLLHYNHEPLQICQANKTLYITEKWKENYE